VTVKTGIGDIQVNLEITVTVTESRYIYLSNVKVKKYAIVTLETGIPTLSVRAMCRVIFLQDALLK
jgi:hypothetical protein